ncbi:hypothetical protein [Pseudomonas sp. NPDC088444]|uniref:hypothetical protein n=1 Tax=Pseudomonas sp. NPDC088444 TaxID=3364456 RepID=UPI00384D5211
MRITVAIFQAAGLFIGVLLIASADRSAKKNVLFSLLAAAVLMCWMVPRHKLFDISLSIFLVGLLAYLVQYQTAKRYFIAGLGLGLIAIFGRNHGMYGLAGSLGVLIWLVWKHAEDAQPIRGVLYWGLGVVAGYSPLLVMVCFIPGFFRAFWESILFLFDQQATNLPLPIPWPWTVNFSGTTLIQGTEWFVVGIFFIALLVSGSALLAFTLYQRCRGRAVSPVLVACAFLSLPYAHYAYSRADIGHLAQGIFPMLIGLLALAGSLPVTLRWASGLILLLMSVLASIELHPVWQCYARVACVDVTVSGSELKIDQDTAGAIDLLRKLTSEYAADGRSYLVAPYWPGGYAINERKSPMWEVYALFPRSESFERKEIERIEEAQPGFAVIMDVPLDGRQELRFQNSHPYINKYITENFILLPNSPSPAYKIYKRKSQVDQ